MLHRSSSSAKNIVVEGGHHGGAWKVAYADFVTAMMAFFMLMWLLNATTEKQRKGIADYFSPVAPISRMSSGSDGMFMGESVFAEDVLPKVGTGAYGLDEGGGENAPGGTDPTVDADDKSTAFEEIQSTLLAMRGESMVDDNWLRHMISEVTDEGLVLEFFDVPNDPLFDHDDMPTQTLKHIARVVFEISEDLYDDIAVEAHVATGPVVRREDQSWGRSSDRAFKTAELLSSVGIEEDRIRRVTAYADQQPAVDNLMSLRNNRVEIVFPA